MRDFNYYAPTQVVFGEHSEEKVADLVKHYGGLEVILLGGVAHNGLEQDSPA